MDPLQELEKGVADANGDSHSVSLASPSAMKELIHYFEKHGDLLDRQDPGDSISPRPSLDAGSFISCIRFNGVPILPPVMTSSRLEEMRQERHNAIFQEKRQRARQRKHLMAVASSLVENAESPKPAAESKAEKPSAARLERPMVLKPVVTSAWASLSASAVSASTGGHSVDSVNTLESNIASTFAAAEQAPDDFGLQTLDSMCSDFMSLEETLPTDFNGEPLTSVKQQKISQDLLRLSKILKVKDFNSTGGSTASELPSSECKDEVRWSEQSQSAGTSTPALDNVSGSFFHESQDTVVEVAGDISGENTTSGFADNSTEGSPAEISSQGDGNFSGLGSGNTSGMSSANTTGTTDSHRSNRSSPRSMKNNTVHFASFVTEYIDTSASLSSESITVVKKKLPAEQRPGDRQGSRADAGSDSSRPSDNGEENAQGHDLLCNVSLAESDSPLTPVPTNDPSHLPFQLYTKADPSSSDKENDAKQANRKSGLGSEASLGFVAHRSGDKTGTNPAGSASVTDSQGSSRSDATAATSESSNSTLIEEAANANRDSSNTLPLNIVETKGEGDSEKESQKTSDAPPQRKPKKLPPEPIQGSNYQQAKTGSAKNLTSHSSNTAEAQRRGHHVRRGSYTLIEPSPALVRAQGIFGREQTSTSGGVESKKAQRKSKPEATEAQAKPLNIPLNPTVPLEPESTGKAEHISKYLSQVQFHASEDMMSSQLSEDLSHMHAAVSAHLSAGGASQLSHVATNGGDTRGGGEVVQEFHAVRQNLLEQQQKELEELFVQQRREQMLLQNEIEEHQKRMKEQQEFLISNAPENIKIKSQGHDGELSPNSSLGQETSTKRLHYPAPKQTQIHVNDQRVGGGGAPSSLLLLNTSAASSTSPRVRRPVLRSPVKFHPSGRVNHRVVVPNKAYEPEMRVKFDKLTALAKGFLCRCLLRSDKVQELVKTIKDTREFAFSFQAETPIKKGNFSQQDRTLLERIVAQLQAALLDIHEIFFDIPVAEQMALIEQTRLSNMERRMKLSTEESVRSSAPRISTATLKAQERRRRAQEAESAVFGSSSSRPRSSPPTTSSPRSVDLSGPLKRHYQFLLSRSMKPAAMAASHQHPPVSPIRHDSRSEKNRPQTAPEKLSSSRPKKPVSSTSTSNSHTLESAQAKLNIRPKHPPSQPQQSASASASSHKNTKVTKSAKSWR